jgi:glyoxylase-like metal-dependent hydrolase (beta-lactamase superfamily II)
MVFQARTGATVIAQRKEATMSRKFKSARFNVVKIAAIAGVAAGILAVHGSPVSAFSHKKFQQQLQDLTKPPAEQRPAQQTAPPSVKQPPEVKRLPGVNQPAAVKPAQPVKQQKPPPKRSIANIAGDVYQFKNNFHNSVFMVTPGGIVFIDPIDKDASAWLKAELRRRFNQPVKYVIYSHDHRDHIAGGEVFADTALYVGHDNAKANIIAEKRPTPVPDITFSDELTLSLGGKTVRLTYVGPSHSNSMIVVNFPDARVLHIVDIFTKNRVGYKGLSDSYFPGWIDALRKVEGMDYDIVSPGHGALAARADVAAARGYFEDLYAAVVSGVRAGKSLAELQSGITLEKYKHFAMRDKWMKMNIEGVYKRVSLQRRGN